MTDQLDYMQQMIDELVRKMNWRQCQQWLRVVKQQKDPRNLPYYSEYAELFQPGHDIFGRPVLVMHFMVLTSFVALAEIKVYNRTE